MGYYTGQGAVTSGGESCSAINSYYVNGNQHTVHQRTVTTVTTKSGVQLSVAQGAQGDESLSAWWADTTWTPSFTPGAKGSRTGVSYSRIADSNLYELVITQETMLAKLDNGNWTS